MPYLTLVMFTFGSFGAWFHGKYMVKMSYTIRSFIFTLMYVASYGLTALACYNSGYTWMFWVAVGASTLNSISKHAG